MRIGPAANVARLNVAETITAIWIHAAELRLAGPLDLGNDIEFSEVTPAEITANQNDFATGTVTVLRLATDASRSISGFAGGRGGRFLAIVNVGTFDLVLLRLSSGSVAANRIQNGTGANITLGGGSACLLWYDNNTDLSPYPAWHVVAIVN